MLSIKELTARHAQNGRVEWIGIRPQRNVPVIPLSSVEIEEKGLKGDRTLRPSARSVTLIQHEHLPVIAALGGLESVEPEILRRNLVVSGISLLALKDRVFQIGDVILEGTGICAPCSKMEAALGTGAYNAMRGHGGITASVKQVGMVCVNDPIIPIEK